MKNGSRPSTTKSIQKWRYPIMAAAALLLCLWRCKYGFCSYDEQFYYSIPFRLVQGDALFVNEWHLSQLSSFLLLPFVKIYNMFFKGNEGIFLSGRYFYTIIHFVVALAVFLKYRNYGPFSFFAALSYFLFVPFGIAAYSYNALALDCLMISAVMLSDKGKASRIGFFLSGLFYAGAVICCPYLLLGYFLFALYILFFDPKRKTRLFEKKDLLYFTSGAFLLCVIFLSFIFSRTTLTDVIANIPFILNDPEHPTLPLKERAASAIYSVLFCHPLFQYVFLLYALIVIAVFFDKKRRERRRVYFYASAIITVICYCIFLTDTSGKFNNAALMPMMFIGFISYILCSDKPARIFVTLFLTGCIYALCLSFSSNTFFYVITMALSLSGTAGIIFQGELIREIRNDEGGKNVWPAGLACIIMLLALQLNLAFTHFYAQQETPFNGLDHMIESGPAAGIYSSSDDYCEYNAVRDDLDLFRNADGGNVLYLYDSAWCYLYTDNLRSAAYSAWLSTDAESNESKLYSYWSLNPQKEPDFIYVPKELYWNIEPEVILAKLHQNGFSVEEGEAGYIAQR